jgi:hypothetical protein
MQKEIKKKGGGARNWICLWLLLMHRHNMKYKLVIHAMSFEINFKVDQTDIFNVYKNQMIES